MMTNSEEAKPIDHDLQAPCHDCPMRRDSIPGWLGGASAEEYRQLCHSDAIVDCHAYEGSQCAGVAIYRANVCKRADPPNLKLPADTKVVFATPMEFVEWHAWENRATSFAKRRAMPNA